MSNAAEPQSDPFDAFVHTLSDAESTRVPVDNRTPLVLDNAGAAWLVVTGAVDVFYLRDNGAREFVIRVPSGQALFGLSGAGSVIAAGGPDTRVLATTQARLFEFGSTAPLNTLVGELYDTWVAALYAAVTASTPVPQAQTILKPNESFTLNDGSVARPLEGVLSIQLDSGKANWLGRADMTLEQGARIPLAQRGYLVAVGNTQVSTGTSGSLRQGNQGETAIHALDALHALVLRALAQRTTKEITAEQTRLAQKKANDVARVSSAFSEFAHVLQGTHDTLDSGSPAADVLFDTSVRVAEASHIQLTKPVARYQDGVHDPLGEIVRSSRIATRRVHLKGEWWRAEGAPLLAYRAADKQPCALLWEHNQYLLVDAVANTRQVLTASLAASFDEYAVMFYRPFADGALSWKELLRFGATGNERTLLFILLLGMGVGLLALVTPIATGILFNTIIPNTSVSELVQLGAVLLVAAIASALLTASQTLSSLRVENQMDLELQAAVWDRLLKLPVPFFRNYSTGDLANRALGISAIRQALTGPVIFAFLGLIFSVFSFALMFYYSIELGRIGTGLVLVAVLITALAAYIQVRYQRAITNIQGNLSSTLLQFLTSISKLRVSGTEDRAYAVWADGYSTQQALTYRAALVNGGLSVFNTTFPILAALVLFLAITLSAGPLIDTGTFLAFNAAFAQFLGAMLAVSTALISVLTIVPTYERAKPIFQTLPEVDNEKEPPGVLHGKVELRNVSFRYSPDTPFVLNNVSLRAEAGEFIAIVGPSGAGKSTLLRMLLGFDQPATGTVLYDGQSLSDLDVRAVRRQIGTVLQSSNVMPGSILNNIIGAQPLSMEDAWAAAQAAGLDADIRAMPMGMQTVLIGQGGSLSGGQQQRLLIARAIVNKPRIVLFDEATSALDNRTQAIVTDSLKHLHATRIVIAHRLSTIIDADRIYVLANGTISQSGTYRELISQPGLFADLAKRQLV